MDPEELQQIRRLLALVDRYGLAELSLRDGDVHLTIRGPAGISPPPVPSVAVVAMPDVALRHGGEPVMGEAIESDPGLLDATDESDSADGDGHHALRSPLTGIFYRSASPDSPPFVQVGDEVAEGQTVGLIEAMKVFSEIPSDAGGRVVRIIAEPGVLISQGDVLMTIDSAAAPV